MNKLSEIKQRLDKATPGPWDKRGGATPYYTVIVAGEEMIVSGFGDYDVISDACPSYDQQFDNAKFIANTPTDITYLINLVERLREIIVGAVPAAHLIADGRSLDWRTDRDSILKELEEAE